MPRELWTLLERSGYVSKATKGADLAVTFEPGAGREIVPRQTRTKRGATRAR